MRDDKSLCKCYGRKHENLAYNWRLGGRWCWVAYSVWASYCYSRTGTCCAYIFSLIYPVFLCLFPFSTDTAWPDYNVVDWADKLSYSLKALIIIHALK